MKLRQDVRHSATRAMARAWTHVYDLDGTLYPIASGYEAACRERVFEYMVSRLGCASRASAERLWREHFAVHNQTLKSLRAAGFVVDADEYWTYSRGDPREYLSTSSATRAAVEACGGGRRFVFTNAHERQAGETLDALGLNGLFDGVFGAKGMGETCKPQAEAFEAFFAAHGIDDPSRCVFFEDSLKNLRVASERFGMVTVLVAGPTLDEELENGASEATEATKFVDIIVRGGELTLDALAAGVAAGSARGRDALAHLLLEP